MNKKFLVKIFIIIIVVIITSIIFSIYTYNKNVKKEFIQFCNNDSYVCGFINDEFENKIIKRIEGGARVIKISSAGGQQLTAMRIANRLNQLGIKVKIDGVCLSACAQSIFLGVKKISVSKRSFVAFHNSSTFSLLVAQNRQFINEADYLKFLNLSKKASVAEVQFFKKNNLNPDALLFPAVAMNFKCISRDFVHTRLGLFFRYKSEADWFTPDEKLVISWRGNRAFSSWPGRDREFFKTLLQYYPLFIRTHAVLFGNMASDMELQKGLQRRLQRYVQKIKTCS